MRLNCTQKDACCMWAYICVQKSRENFFKIYALLLYKFCMMLLPLKHTCFFCCISFNVNCIYSRQRLYCFYRMIVNIANKLSCMIWGQKANKGSFVHTHRSTAQMHREILLKKYYIYGAVNHSTNEETNKSSNFTLKILFVCPKLILCRWRRPR